MATRRQEGSAGEITASIWRCRLKTLSTANDPLCFWVILADDGEPLVHATRLSKFHQHPRPDSMIRLIHNSRIANKEHPMLRSRQQYVGAIRGSEETDRPEQLSIIIISLASHERD